MKLFRLLEKTHNRHNWDVTSLEGAQEAWSIAKRIDRGMPGWARNSWRWRIVYIRSAIDHILDTKDPTEPQSKEALGSLCAKLAGIYYAEDTAIRPPTIQ